jgi:hypothetical protein
VIVEKPLAGTISGVIASSTIAAISPAADVGRRDSRERFRSIDRNSGRRRVLRGHLDPGLICRRIAVIIRGPFISAPGDAGHAGKVRCAIGGHCVGPQRIVIVAVWLGRGVLQHLS